MGFTPANFPFSTSGQARDRQTDAHTEYRQGHRCIMRLPYEGGGTTVQC